MPRIIAVLSGKGGVGKTTLASNIATSLALDFKKSVAVVDGNITAPSLGLHFGFHEKFPVSLNDVLEGKLSIKRCIYTHPTLGVAIIPCNFAFYSDKHIEKLSGVLKDLDYDYIIIDGAPGLGKEPIAALQAAKEVIAITVPQFVDVSNALKTLQLARKAKKRVLGIVLNRITGHRHEISEKEISDLCECSILAEIPEDKEVQEATYAGLPVVAYNPKARASAQFRRVAGHVAESRHSPREGQAEKKKQEVSFEVKASFGGKRKKAKPKKRGKVNFKVKTTI
jgi:MinD-like ATPase involved in chromosome partitioning or flagellar assembly